MRKKFKIEAVFLIFVFILYPAYAQSIAQQETHTLLIEKIEVPDVIYPGDTFTLTFYVRNAWYRPVDDPFVYLEGGYPFLKVSPTKPIKLEPLIYEYDPWFRKFAKVSYNITVEKDAVAGSYTIYAVFSFTKCSPALRMEGCARERFTERIPIKITIRGKPKLKVFLEGSKPEEVYAGDRAEIEFSVANLGSDTARNCIAKFSASKDLKVFWYSKEIYLGDIKPRSKSFGKVVIDVPEDVKPGKYKIPVTILYKDWSGGLLKEYDEIEIEVKEEADFKAYPANEILESDTKDNYVSFFIENSGTKKAEELKVILRASYPFTPTGGEYYVGDLEPGEKAKVVFHVDVDAKASSQRYPVDIILQWKEEDEERSKVISSYIEVRKKKEPIEIYISALAVVLALIMIVKLKKKFSRKTA